MRLWLLIKFPFLKIHRTRNEKIQFQDTNSILGEEKLPQQPYVIRDILLLIGRSFLNINDIVAANHVLKLCCIDYQVIKIKAGKLLVKSLGSAVHNRNEFTQLRYD